MGDIKTNDAANQQKPDGQAPSRSDFSVKQKRWNVLMDGQVIGSIHGQTEAQARATIAVLRMPELKISPAE